MITELYAPLSFPNGRKECVIEEEFYEKNDIIEAKSYDEICNIISASNGYFNQILEQNIEEPKLIEIYEYLIQNIKHAPIPNEKCQFIIEKHVIDIENIKLSKVSMKYLSHFAQTNSELESRILSNINHQKLLEYFSLFSEDDPIEFQLAFSEDQPSRPIIDEDLFQLLQTFLEFSPSISQFCKDKEIYSKLFSFDDFEEERLFYKLSLIKESLFSINSSENHLYEQAFQYFMFKIEKGIIDIDNQELICFCVSHCLIKMTDENLKKCLQSLLDTNIFDWILPYWEIYINKFDEKTVSINFSISIIIALISMSFPDRLNKRLFSKWIKDHMIIIPIKKEEKMKNEEAEEEEEEAEIDEIEENYLKFQKKINDINVYLITTLIFLLREDSFNISYLFLPFNSGSAIDKTLVDHIYDFIDFGNCEIKNVSVQFFWTLCNCKNSRTITNYILPYFADHNVVEKSILFFEELDGISLKETLKGILKIIDQAELFANSPILNQIKTEENFQILQRVALNNLDDEVKVFANEILKKVFVSQVEDEG